ncbi:MAG: C45 family peptidase [Pseudomonadota bacterium]
MSTDSAYPEWLNISGSPFEIGLSLGNKGREAVHSHLITSEIWHEVNHSKHRAACARMMEHTQSAFPGIMEEIRGLAYGLEMPFENVFAWNCRGDLLARLPDGCTSVQLPGSPQVLAHNEDGLPFFDGHCFIANVSAGGQFSFWSFCYPGSIPGHTFALNRHNLAFTANNLRLENIAADIPRMVIGRAILECRNMGEALDQIGNRPATGGFHFTLAQPGEPTMVSLEFGGGDVACKEVTRPCLHANHGLHGRFENSRQIITQSSRDRQQRGETMLALGELDPMTILRDCEGPGLPIWRRSADDPDQENTLASVVFRIGKDRVNWTIYNGASHSPAHEYAKENF